MLIQPGLYKCKLNGDGVLVQSKNDSSIGSKKTVFELKIDCWGCEQSENIKNRATSSKGFRSNAENVFLIEGNNDFL